MTRIQRRLLIDTSVIGITLTLFVVIVDYSSHLLQPLEDWFYDRRARLCQFFTPPPTDKLIHVDIDDSSIDAIGKWPWPRAVMAELIDEIDRAGASAISMDIIYSEPSEPRYLKLGPGRYREIDDDALFADALRRSGRCLVPVAFEVYVPLHPVVRKLREYLTADLEVNEGTCFKWLLEDPEKPLPPGSKFPVDHFLAARKEAMKVRIRRELEAPDFVRRVTGPWIEYAFARAARKGLAPASPLPPAPGAALLEELRRRLLPRTDPEITGSPLLRLLSEEFRHVLAIRQLSRLMLPIPPGLPPLAKFEREQQVPILPFTQAAALSGYVNYLRGEGGVIRALPLFAEYRGRLFPQSDIVLACAVLGVDVRTLRLEKNSVIIPKPPGHDRDIVIPVRVAYSSEVGGEVGMFMDVPDRGTSDWEFIYDVNHKRPELHLPMTALWDVHTTRDRIARNNANIDKALDFILGGNAKDRRDLRLKLDPARAEKYAANRPGAEDTVARRAIIEWTRKELADSGFLDMLKLKDEEFQLPPGRKFKDDDERMEAEEELVRQRIQRDELRVANNAINSLFDQNTRFDAQLVDRRAQLKDKINGRAALIGWVGTGGIDAYPTAIHPTCPGVVIHGLTYNAIMTGDFWRHAPKWVTLLITVLIGLLVTAANGFLKPFHALLVVIAIGLAYLLLNGLLLFDKGGLVVGVAGPMVALASVWSTGALAGFLIEATERARITKRFSSYVDQKLVDYVIENPDAALDGQVREMSVIFTDLAGFTTLAEKLEERTVGILSEYLGLMVPIIRKHDGLVNKFLGDGIMCFFNAPRNDPSHAVHAVQTVLEMQTAMKSFADAMAEQGFPRVAMRCGVATGNMVVGDSGPADASDYTVLGNNVNFASRLEGANKATGTNILISERTAELLADRYLLRPVGRLQVVGKSEGVMTYEPLAPIDQATIDDRLRCAGCAEMIAAYIARDFQKCIEVSLRLDDQFGLTKLTALYRRTAEACLQNPPGPEFCGNLILTEK